MNLVEQSVQIPAGGVVLDADMALPEPASGKVAAVPRTAAAAAGQPRNRYVARELHTFGLATVLADLLTPAEEQLDARTRPSPVRHWPARRSGDGPNGLGNENTGPRPACRSGCSAPARAPPPRWSRPPGGPARSPRSFPAAAVPTWPASTCAR